MWQEKYPQPRVGYTGLPHGMAAGENLKGASRRPHLNSLRKQRLVLFFVLFFSKTKQQPHVFSSTLHLMHDIKNSISDIIVSSTNTDIPNLKCSTGTDTELDCCSGTFRIWLHRVYDRKITSYQDLLDAFKSKTHSAVYPWIRYTSNPDVTFSNQKKGGKKRCFFMSIRCFTNFRQVTVQIFPFFRPRDITPLPPIVKKKQKNNWRKASDIYGKLWVSIFPLKSCLMVNY